MNRANNSSQATLFTQHFATLADPRQRRRFPLINLLFIALAATVAGAEGWDAMVSFAQSKRAWLAQSLDLHKGIPSADTIRRVFQVLDPEAFEECFRAWVHALAQTLRGEVVALDGKSSKGVTHPSHPSAPLHLLHVWATKQRRLLAQRAVPGAPGEPAGALALLELLALEGAVVTADANLCTKKLAPKALDQGAEYVLALKGNRWTDLQTGQAVLATGRSRGDEPCPDPSSSASQQRAWSPRRAHELRRSGPSSAKREYALARIALDRKGAAHTAH